MSSNQTVGVASVLSASILWGTTGTAASFAPDISSLAIGAFAMGVAAILLGLNSARILSRNALRIWANPKLLLIGGASVAAYPLAFYSSMRLSGVAIGTVVSLASAPFFSVLIERYINRKHVTSRWLTSFLFGVIGVVMIFIGKGSALDATSTVSLTYGVLLGLLAGLTYATYSWVARWHIASGIESSASMASMFLVASSVLLPSLAITGDNLFATTTNTFVSIYMATIPMFLGYLLFGHGLKFIEASRATLITLFEPAVAVLFAVIFVGERFSIIGWVGLACILVCMLLQAFSDNE